MMTSGNENDAKVMFDKLHDIDKRLSVVVNQFENYQIEIIDLKKTIQIFVNSYWSANTELTCKIAKHDAKIENIEARMNRLPLLVGSIVAVLNLIFMVANTLLKQ